MNALTPTSPPSSVNRAGEKRALILAFVGAFGLHALLAGLLHSQFSVAPAKKNPGFQMAFVVPGQGTGRETIHEPTLLAYPSRRGFSQGALAQPLSSPVVPPSYQDHGDFLPNPANPRGASLVAGISAAPRAHFDRFPPQPQEEPLLLPARPEPRSTAILTALTVERVWLGAPTLPLLENAPVRPTVVRCCVNPAGTVTAVLLDKSSGNEAADQLALRETARWLFRTRNDAAESDLDWLLVTVQWSAKPKAP